MVRLDTQAESDSPIRTAFDRTVDPTASDRKVDRGATATGCPVHRGPDGVWHVRGYAAGLAVLRSPHTVQAGAGIDKVEHVPMPEPPPVNYQDGPAHREHRRATARFFTPRRVDEHYREIMERVTDEILERLRRHGSGDLGEMSFELTVAVAASVIGLTESRPGLARRLERWNPQRMGRPGFTSLHGLYWLARLMWTLGQIYVADVRPALRARRKQRRDDLLSHLLDQGWGLHAIMAEVITYGFAGMMTTREFINVAAWHLFTNDDLRRAYLTGTEAERVVILHELLRLEPVLGNLKRRNPAPIEVPGPDGPVIIPAGQLVDVDVSAANLDPAAVGDHPTLICPGRKVGAGASPTGLAFGAGPHRCPGAFIAIQETDIFLHRLLSEPGIRMVSPPGISIEELSGYEARGLVVAVR